jgi:4-hydroxybenzoyl-CoA reductase subunit beta
MRLPDFQLHHPKSLEDLRVLTQKLQKSGEAFDFIAGGTDVLPNYKNRLNPKEEVISLSKIEGLTQISPTCIGAMARVRDIAENKELQAYFPGLIQAAQLVASPILRNLATLGGNLLLDTRCYYFNQSEFWRASKGYCLKANGDECLVVPQKEICYATYSGDLAPLFLVLDAKFELDGPEGTRRIPARDFYRFDGIDRFVKHPQEILTYIHIPTSAQELKTGYRKLRARDTIEYPVMGVAMGLATCDESIEKLEIAVTGSEAIPLWYGDLGFSGERLCEDTAEGIRKALLEKVKTYKNVPFPPGYRRSMAGEFVKDLFFSLS